jgi:radical SAM/Cys-rich protein
MRGQGVFDKSIQALQWLNRLGYSSNPNLILDLVYNPPVPTATEKFALPPEQHQLEAAYKAYLSEQFGIQFDRLLTITNLPIGRTKQFLQRQKLDLAYTQFLEQHFNPSTIANLMCRNQLSIDYLGNVYDCDFNQMEQLPARLKTGETFTVAKLLELGSLEAIAEISTAPFCYGCTAGSGSSCGGALV